MSSFNPSIPSEYLEFFSNYQYSGLPDFKVRGGQVYFLTQVARTGIVELWKTEKGGTPSKISADDTSVGSNLNCYGASSFAVTSGGNGVFFLSGKELFRVKDGVQSVYKLPESEKYAYGDPVIAKNYIFMVRDAQGEQSVIRWSFEELDKNIEPKIIEKPGDFYGNLAVNPSESRILFNSWNNGMPFEKADVLIRNVDGEDNRSVVFTHPFGPVKYPCWFSDEDFIYISDSTGHDKIYGNSLVNNDWGKFESIYNGIEDIGEPLWLVGQQWPIVATPEFFIFADAKKVYIHSLKTSETKSIGISNVNLIRLDPEDPKLVYFRRSGVTNTSIQVINLDQPNLPVEDIFEVNYIPKDSKIKAFTPEWTQLNHIPGLITSPSKDIVPRPTIIWLHGGPTMRLSPTFDLRKQIFVASGFNVVEPAFSGTAGFGRDLRRKLYGQWGIADAQDICDIIPFLVEKGYSLPDKIYLVGSSSGAYLALCAIARSQENTIAGASITASFYDLQVVVDESVPFEQACSKHLSPSYPWDLVGGLLRKKVPIAFYHGSKDPVVNASAPAELSKKLSDAGIRSSFKLYEGEGHGLKKSENIFDWIKSTMDFFK